MTILMIVESPHKAKEIGKFLGSEYDVRASYGHVRDLPPKGQEDGEIVVGIGRDFRARYVVGDRARGAVKKLKDAAKRADRVVLAMDPDREGEAIAWHLKQVLGLKDADRVTYQEISAKAVRAALAQPRKIDMALVKAQEARRLLDRLVGYTVSPILSSQSSQSLSAGRVQTPALRLVVERERAISAFVPQKHFGVELGFEGGWKAQWMIKPHLAEGEEFWLDAATADQVAATRRLLVDDYADGTAKEAPPAPFTTSTLQQEASKKLGMKVKEVMDAAQALFDSGAITYHRTDNPNFLDEGHGLIRAYAQEAGLPLADAPRTWKAKAGAQEGHEAIRPVDLAREAAGATEVHRKLYQLIRRRALASQMIDATYATRTAKLQALDIQPVRGKAPIFVAKGKVLTEPGWREVYGATVDDDEDDEEGSAAGHSNPIPKLSTGAEVAAQSGRRLDKTTKPPQRFTEAGLVKELEARGIGRPSTYASIIGNISGRGYIEPVGPKGKYLGPSQTGCAIVDALAGKCQFADYEFTANIETELDEVAAGERQFKAVLQSSWQQLESEVGGLKVNLPDEPQHPCPDCGQPLHRRKGGKGFFWGCTGYPECRTTLPDARGKPGAKREGSGSGGGPSKKQLDFAQSVADACGEEIPADARDNGRKLSEWIDKHKSALPAKGKGGGSASKGRRGARSGEGASNASRGGGRAPAPPSDAQMGYAEKIAQAKGLVIPSAAVVDRKELSKWIDQYR